jgi:pyridoxal phosphate enzyme (YggS family)
MAPFVHLVHGVDREKVLKELNKEAVKCKRTIDCLLQVHIAQEESKFGFDADELKMLLSENLSEKYPNISVCGLMGMATFTDDQSQVQREFQMLKKLFDEFQETYKSQLKTFNTLSIGMSGDYALAIAEGSNMVRVGTAIFGERNY